MQPEPAFRTGLRIFELVHEPDLPIQLARRQFTLRFDPLFGLRGSGHRERAERLLWQANLESHRFVADLLSTDFEADAIRSCLLDQNGCSSITVGGEPSSACVEARPSGASIQVFTAESQDRRPEAGRGEGFAEQRRTGWRHRCERSSDAQEGNGSQCLRRGFRDRRTDCSKRHPMLAARQANKLKSGGIGLSPPFPFHVGLEFTEHFTIATNLQPI